MLDLAGPLQALATANELSGAIVPPYAPHIVSQGGSLVTVSAGLPISAEPLGPVDAPLDTLIIPGGRGVHQAATDRALVDWIDKRAGAARRIASVCTERSFARHYHARVGATPSSAVERMRIEAARRLLIDTSQPVKRIAARCGFGSEETMRRAFLQCLSINPQDYRARFSA